jgi:DNA polymerase-3 subunit gamma/tau
MSYTVLARRYRSGTFDEVIGQEHVAQTLKKAIASDRVAHAYLFCGTRGVGKTSMARILARALNCKAADQPTPQPCGKCESCLAIASGEDMDVIEIDAASNTGVDNVRDIIENSQYRPAISRFKVYIIDEVHMLSKPAFNALLKTLEEPPEHVKFILATTETEKVLPTILSRCQRYDFRNIPTREIAAHLKEICKKEKIKADDDALLLVAKAGAGSMRDALSLLDRLLSIGEKQLTADMIEQLLGLPKSQLVFDLAQAVGDGDIGSVLSRADAMIASGLSVDALVAALTDHLRNLLVLRTCGADSQLVEVPGLPLEDLSSQAERFDPVALTQDIVILEELRRNVRQSQAGRALLDATLVRMALADQFSSIGELLSRLDGGGPADVSGRARPAGSGRAPQLPAKSPAQAPLRSQAASPPASPPAQKKKPDEVSQGAGMPGQASEEAWKGEPAPEPAPAAEAAPVVTSDESADDDDDDLPRPGKVWDGPSLKSLVEEERAKAAATVPVAAPALADSATSPAGANVEPVSPDDLQGVWRSLLQVLASRGPGLLGLLSHGRLVAIEDGRAVIRYGAQHETFVKMLEKNGKKELVRDAITQLLNQSVGVKFEVEPEEPMAAEAATPQAPERSAAARAGPPVPSPAQAPAPRVTAELVQSLREKEPLVRALMDELGAQVIKVE